MKILIVTPPMHYKNSGAAQKDVYACIRHLKEMGHEVILCSIDSPQQDSPTFTWIENEYGIEVVRIQPDISSLMLWLYHSLLDVRLFDRSAYVFSRMIREGDAFKGVIRRTRPDRIICFTSFSWPVISYAHKLGIKTILRSHNFEPTFFWEELTIVKRLLPWNWIRFLAKWFGEKTAVQRAHSVGTLLFSGVERYKKWKPQSVFDLTLMFPAFSIQEPWVHFDKKIIDVFYLGASYNIIFHLRGAELLIKDIAPKVLRAAPGKFRFHILGSKLPAQLVSLCNATTITYEGYVADLDAFLSNMDVGAFPVFTGSTMKGKVFDTLTRAFPVVMPHLGMGKYVLKDGTDVLIADSTDEFVAAILSLSDSQLRLRLSGGASQFTKEIFGTLAVRNALQNVLEA